MGTSKPDLKESPIKPKFDPHKKISLSTDAPANSKDFDVTYDAKIGENFFGCGLIFDRQQKKIHEYFLPYNNL